jgi:hypothetical protein
MVSVIPGKLMANGRFFPDCWGKHFKERYSAILQLVLPKTFRGSETAFTLKEFMLTALVHPALKGLPVAFG